jgi:hypothetical protein
MEALDAAADEGTGRLHGDAGIIGGNDQHRPVGDRRHRAVEVANLAHGFLPAGAKHGRAGEASGPGMLGSGP